MGIQKEDIAKLREDSKKEAHEAKERRKGVAKKAAANVKENEAAAIIAITPTKAKPDEVSCDGATLARDGTHDGLRCAEGEAG